MFSFEGEVSGETLRRMLTYIKSEYFRQVTSKLRPIINDIPSNIVICILLAGWTAETILYLNESRATWTAFSTTFEIARGQVAQVRGYEEASIDRYLSSLAYLIQIDKKHKYNLNPVEKLQVITDYLVKNGEPTAIETLYRFLNTRLPSDLYKAIRQIDRVGGIVGKGFCRELAWLTRLT
jgi:hypothetical protein